MAAETAPQKSSHTPQSTAASRKRKRPSSSNKPNPHNHQKQSSKISKKKKQKNSSSTTGEAAKAGEDDGSTVDPSVAGLSPAESSQLFAECATRFLSEDLSSLELGELVLPDEAADDSLEQTIIDSRSWTEVRTQEHLPDFLQHFANGRNLRKAPKENGHPHTLVVTAAGLRAADLTRSLRTLQTPTAKITKLFAKHIKLSAALETCKTTRMNIGVGTPARIAELIADGALSTADLRLVVLDASWVDVKGRGVLRMKDVAEPLVRLLAMREVNGAGEGDGVAPRVLFY